MRISSTILGLAVMLGAAPANAGPAEDAAAAVASLLDKFNAGDIKAFADAHRDGALIIDEFPPYQWGGSGSLKRWGEDYTKDATARGITAGRIDYGPPLQAHSNGVSAYVVMPTTYRFQQKGAKMAGKGSMTFVMARTGGAWKISSWTYSGATPVADK
jgi:ketosteroid isomerase-like protein